MSNKIKSLDHESDPMPKSLCSIYDAPKQLYYRGQKPDNDSVCVAIIGTRKPTHYGKQSTSFITSELVRQGVTVVSGLALGVDAIAHETAVNEGGRTIAVMPAGLDSIYPRSNERLAERILKSKGTLVSEYAAGISPKKYHFVARNRIVSGLSQAVVVIEATQRSGTRITTDFALQQDRLVMAVPGPIQSPFSTGPNNLIAQGAHIVTSARDIVEILGQHYELIPRQEAESTGDQKDILAALTDHTPRSVQEIQVSTNMPIEQTQRALSELELLRRIARTSDGRFAKV